MLARLRRPKATCSPAYANCRPKTNAAILWDTGHTSGGCAREGLSKERKPKT
jgi:hypothetical protein